jgi:Flp pilus assembly protein TadD
LIGDSATAIAALQHSVALNPRDPSAHYQLARALEQSGDNANAELERQQFIELKKSQPITGGMATGRVQ